MDKIDKLSSNCLKEFLIIRRKSTKLLIFKLHMVMKEK